MTSQPSSVSTADSSPLRSTDTRADEPDSRHPSVFHTLYRQKNMRTNGIDIRDSSDQLPAHVLVHVLAARAARGSPNLTVDELRAHLRRVDILARGCNAADVESFLKYAVLPGHSDPIYGRASGLKGESSASLPADFMTENPRSHLPLEKPKPDYLYGYSGDAQDGAFTTTQFLSQTWFVGDRRLEHATPGGLRFPFLAIHVKAAGGAGTRGDLWVAANECAVSSAVCLDIVDNLNVILPDTEQSSHRVENLSYAIAVDNNAAQLFVAWKEDQPVRYYLQRVNTFLLCSQEGFQGLRVHVRNILDWGKGARLAQIQRALDITLEDAQKETAQAAKLEHPSAEE